MLVNIVTYFVTRGPGSVVGKATAYRLDGPAIESWWGRDFPLLSRLALKLTQPPVDGCQIFPGLRCGWGVTLTPQPLVLPRSKIEQSYNSTLPKDLRGLYKIETYFVTMNHEATLPICWRSVFDSAANGE
jgi:hypothetical protein